MREGVRLIVGTLAARWDGNFTPKGAEMFLRLNKLAARKTEQTCYNFLPLRIFFWQRMDMASKKKKTSSRKKSPAKKSRKPAAGKKTSRSPKNEAPPPEAPRQLTLWERLSTERRKDIIGVGLFFLGLLVLLAAVSPSNSTVLGLLVHYLHLAFGWGVVLLALGLMLAGGWLLLRKTGALPEPGPEHWVGLWSLYFLSLTVLHRLAGSVAEAEALAARGIGGGAFGSLFVRLLWRGLGGPGAWVVLFGWGLLGLALTLNTSVFHIVTTFWRWNRLVWGTLWRRLHPPQPEPVAPSEAVPAEADLMPIGAADSPPAEQAAAAAPSAEVSFTWQLPDPAQILEKGNAAAVSEEFTQQRARLIEDTLASFGAPAQVVEISRGPAVTMFGVEPLFLETRKGRTRVRVSKIVSLADDLALALAAPSIRIQAPVPGRSYIGIEVPNEEMTLVSLREIVESDLFRRKPHPLRFALGRDVSGSPRVADLTAMPHLLIAGATGSGKSVCVNSILTSFLLHNTPEQLRLLLIDPKRVELTNYNGVPHLLAPVVVEMKRVIGALQWMTREMDKRYHRFSQVGARNIEAYNARMKAQGGETLPYIVVVIDELADLMMMAPTETEAAITRLAQLARATGIHLILATQRPSVDVVTGLIKANFPARIAFAVASGVDSRVILDQPGAERLLGRGDMLYQAPDAPAPVRLQGVFVSDEEIRRLVEYWQAQARAAGSGRAALRPSGGAVDAAPESGLPLKQAPLWEEMEAKSDEDPLLQEAIDLVRRQGRASVSMLQRRLRIGYTRASRLMETMEERGIVSAPQGATGVREVLDYGPAAPPAED